MWRLWLAVSTGATLSGLALSAIGLLNAAGYAAVLVIGGLLALAVWRDESGMAPAACGNGVAAGGVQPP